MNCARLVPLPDHLAGMLESPLPTSLVGKAAFLLGFFEGIRQVLSLLGTT